LTPVTSTFDFHHFYLPPLAFTTISVTVIHKVGLDKIRIVNCMFLPSAKFDVRKYEDDRTPCICPNACAADLHSSRWHNSCTS